MAKTRQLKKRLAAVSKAPLKVAHNNADFDATIDVLRDVTQPVPMRLKALQTLQAASFAVVAFKSRRAAYTAALRAVATDEAPQIRERAIGLLARTKDGYAQKLLLDGLREPEQALVPTEKALQLLSYDAHSEAYSLARGIVASPPSPAAKREALRVLSSDRSATALFEKTLRDKDERPEVRRLAASALHGLKPDRLRAHARAIVLDSTEDSEVQATSLTALTDLGDPADIAADQPLRARVGKLRAAKAAPVKRSARRFATKFGSK